MSIMANFVPISPMHPEAKVGDTVICRGRFVPVLEIKRHEPQSHPTSPIKNELEAIEYVTSVGSRWSGVTRHELECDMEMSLP